MMDDDDLVRQVDEDDHIELYHVGPEPEVPQTGCMRFDFVRHSVAHTMGNVIQIGAGTDPAGLKQLFGNRVCNTDVEVWKTPEKIVFPDVAVDASKPWPFADNSAEMVVMGDVLHLLSPLSQITALKEAHRIAPKVSLTVPCDDREPHLRCLDEALLRHILRQASWYPYMFLETGWGFPRADGVTEMLGYLVEAGRA